MFCFFVFYLATLYYCEFMFLQNFIIFFQFIILILKYWILCFCSKFTTFNIFKSCLYICYFNILWIFILSYALILGHPILYLVLEVFYQVFLFKNSITGILNSLIYLVCTFCHISFINNFTLSYELISCIYLFSELLNF